MQIKTATIWKIYYATSNTTAGMLHWVTNSEFRLPFLLHFFIRITHTGIFIFQKLSVATKGQCPLTQMPPPTARSLASSPSSTFHRHSGQVWANAKKKNTRRNSHCHSQHVITDWASNIGDIHHQRLLAASPAANIQYATASSSWTTHSQSHTHTVSFTARRRYRQMLVQHAASNLWISPPNTTVHSGNSSAASTGTEKTLQGSGA